MYHKILFIVVVLIVPMTVIAHSGGTDSSGGHNCNVGACAGSYHYHNGGYTPPPVWNPPVLVDDPIPAPKPKPVPMPAPVAVSTVTQTYHDTIINDLNKEIDRKEGVIVSLLSEIDSLKKNVASEESLKTEASLERDAARAEVEMLTGKLDGGLVNEVEKLSGDIDNLEKENDSLKMIIAQTQVDTSRVENVNTMSAAGGATAAGILGWVIASYQTRKRKIGTVFGAPRIKGNITRSGEKIYHEPGGQYYNSVVVNLKEGERYFDTIEDAERAGFKRVKL